MKTTMLKLADETVRVSPAFTPDVRVVLLAMREGATEDDEDAFSRLSLAQMHHAGEQMVNAGLATAIDSGTLTPLGERMARMLAGGSGR